MLLRLWVDEGAYESDISTSRASFRATTTFCAFEKQMFCFRILSRTGFSETIFSDYEYTRIALWSKRMILYIISRMALRKCGSESKLVTLTRPRKDSEYWQAYRGIFKWKNVNSPPPFRRNLDTPLNRSHRQFFKISSDALPDFPLMTREDLTIIFSGSHQLSQAVSYLADCRDAERGRYPQFGVPRRIRKHPQSHYRGVERKKL